MVKRGQIVKILPPFTEVDEAIMISDYVTCNRSHRKKGLVGEIMAINHGEDGMYNILILLNCCNELHPIMVMPNDLEIDTLQTLRRKHAMRKLRKTS